jgi:hypothetical protein
MQYSRVVQNTAIALEHSEHDVGAIAAGQGGHHVRTRSRNRFRLGVVGAGRADHVEQFAEHHDIRLLRGRDLLAVLFGPQDRIEPAAGARRAKRDRDGLDRAGRRCPGGREAERVEAHAPVWRPLKNKLDVGRSCPGRRLQCPVEQ